MAIDFYKLGRQTGATTKPGRKSGAEALIGSVTDSIGGLLEASKEKTEELTASMPQGVAIEKVPENLRPQVTNFLTKNKAAYKDATKVLASGINPSSERYTEAVEVINSVNSRFENLSNNLEKIALERQKYLNNPSYSSNTSRAKQTTMYDLANGSLYGKMTLNEDASWNYTDSNGESKAFNDFKVQQPGFLGQNAHVGMLERVDSKNSYDVNGDVKPWKDNLEMDYKSKIEQLFIQLKPAGSLDYVLADTDFLEARLKEEYGTGDVEGYKDMLIEKPGDIINDYKEYSLEQVRKRHENLVNQNKSDIDDSDGKNKQNIIKQFERGDAMIQLDQYNVAIKQKDGTYVTAKNNEASLPSLDTYQGRSANDYIQLLGGNVDFDTEKNFNRLNKLKDGSKENKKTQGV